LLVLFDQLSNAIHFFPFEAAASFEPDRIQPKFGLVLIALNVNVRRLVSISSIKEEAVRSTPQHGRHDATQSKTTAYVSQVVRSPNDLAAI
jgi:hypothetical protein